MTSLAVFSEEIKELRETPRGVAADPHRMEALAESIVTKASTQRRQQVAASFALPREVPKVTSISVYQLDAIKMITMNTFRRAAFMMTGLGVFGVALLSVGVSLWPVALGIGLACFYFAMAVFFGHLYVYTVRTGWFIVGPRYCVLATVGFFGLAITALIAVIEMSWTL